MSHPRRFADLIEPLPPTEFFSSVWTRCFHYIPGPASKFTGLLDWESLNDTLRHHRLDFPRLRLVQAGESLPTSSYLNHVESRRGIQIPRIRVPELTAHLRQGATLVLDSVDEVHEPITKLAELLEYTFHERVQVNAYAAWGKCEGFDCHWDDHDVLVLQAVGSKRWRIYGETRKYPLYRDIVPNEEPPPEAVWDHVLEDGDFLYIPRGWWHGAEPLGEPTLHLTCGIYSRTGIDLLNWLTDQLHNSEMFRKDLPRFASAEVQAEYTDELQKVLSEVCGSGVLDRYFQDCDSKALPRPHLGLPWTAQPDGLALEDDARVCLTAARPLQLRREPGGETIRLAAIGKEWEFAIATESILSALLTRNTYSVRDLYVRCEGKLTHGTLLAFLRELIAKGLLMIVANEPEAPH